MYKLRTVMKQIEPLTLVDGQYNCLNCGMYTKSLIVGLENGQYDLCILYKNDGEDILTYTGINVEI